MKTCLHLLVLVIGLSSLAAPADAIENCYLKNRGSFTAVVRITDDGSGRSRTVRLDPNERVPVQSQNGRIIYEYYYPPEENTFHSKTGARCEDYREIVL